MASSPRRAFDLVMFDLDGTLIATAPELCDALNDTLRTMDLRLVTESSVSSWIGHGTHELVARALSASGEVDIGSVRKSPALQAAWNTFDHHYRSRCATRSYLYPRVREVLQQLHGDGVRLAVVTNKDSRYTHLLLVAHGLAPLLDAVVGGDTLATSKPAPEGVLHCLQRFGVAPGRALLVGDSCVDIATARNAGVQVWAVPYGYNMGQDISASRPDRMIGDLGALLETARS